MTDRLQPLFDERLATLEATAGVPDWADVRRKAGRLAARRRALRLGSAGAIALATVVAATPALGLRGHFIHLFASGKPAPGRVVEDFAQLDVGAPAGMAPGVIAGEAREVMKVPLSTGKTAVMRVAPTRTGGFCLDLSTTGPGAEGSGGCDRDRLGRFSPGLSIPGPISPTGEVLEPPVVLDGSTLIPSALKVAVRYQDGDVGTAPVVWVSGPIDAGFFIYEVPERHWAPGHRPTSFVLEDEDGRELARARSFFDEALQGMTGVDPQTGAPAGAVASKRRELTAITTEQGTRETLWVAPRRGGGRCFWLTSDGHPGRAAGCPPPGGGPAPAEIAVGLLGGSAPILLEGQVGSDAAAVELRYRDGDVLRLAPINGFVLAEIPSRHWPRGRRLDELVALDGAGRTISRRSFETVTPGTYPCAKPVELGSGIKACP